MVTAKKTILFGAAIGVVLLTSGALKAAGRAPTAYVPPTDGPIQANFSLEAASGFNDYALYSLGAAFEGLPLVAVERRHDPPDPNALANANFVTFVYGDCTADNRMETAPDGGCQPPVQVQVWPACERNPSLWSSDSAAVFGDRESVTVRDVPAFFYFEGTQIDIQAGDVTVVVFGTDRDQLRRAADALVPVNPKAVAAMNTVPYPGRSLQPVLPAPEAGALNGNLAC